MATPFRAPGALLPRKSETISAWSVGFDLLLGRGHLGGAGPLIFRDAFIGTVASGDQNVSANGLGVTVAFGQPTVGTQAVNANGLGVAVAFGSPTVTQTVPNNAIRFDAAADALQLATLPSSPTLYSAFMWARLAVDTNFFSALFYARNAADSSWNEPATQADGTTLALFDLSGQVGTFGSLSVGTWVSFGIAINGTSFTVYMGTEGSALTQYTGTISNLSDFGAFVIACSSLTNELFNGAISGLRVWNAALSGAEFEAESQSYTPVRSSNLLGAWFPRGVTDTTAKTAIVGADLINGPHGSPALTVEDGPVIAQRIAPNGLGIIVAFGQPTVATSGLGVSLNGLAVSVNSGQPTITTGAVSVSPNGLAVSVNAGQPTVTPGAVSVSASGLGVAVSFGSPTITTGAVSVSPNGLAVAASLGAPTVTPGAVSVSATGFAVSVSAGQPTITAGAVSVSPNGLAVSVSFGQPTVSASGVSSVSLNGLAVSVSFGLPAVQPGAVSVSLSGLSIVAGLGAVSVSQVISVAGLGAGVAFGLPTLTGAAFDLTVSPLGIVLGVTFGAPLVALIEGSPVYRRPFGSGRYAVSTRPQVRGNRNRWR